MVKIYTLVNGEQIIGEFVDSTAYIESTIENPFYIMEAQDEYGNTGLKLINVCTFSEKQCIIVNNKHIVFSTKANDAMTRYYQKIVEANKKVDAIKMIEESINEMEETEHRLQQSIYERLVRGSTIN
jgi:hypothetical protein